MFCRVGKQRKPTFLILLIILWVLRLNPHYVCLHTLGLNMIKKRFIAGATCKKCQKQDVIRWCKNSETEQEWIECVSCGYHEDKPDEVMQADHPQPSSDGIVNFVKFK